MTDADADRHAAVMRRAADHLRAADPAFDRIVAAAGLCTIGAPESRSGWFAQSSPGAEADAHFAALVGAIIAQQLSTRVAETLTARLQTALDGDVTPAQVLALDEAALRAVGVSGAKARTIRGLAAAVADGDVDLRALDSDDDPGRVRRELTALWGIGRWTAEMFEMFTLHRLDVWPVGDLGLRRGWTVLHTPPGAAAADPPAAAQLEGAGDPLRPYRSVAAWYCWRALDT